MKTSWQSMRIYYYGADKDDLLLNCVRPLMATLRQRGWAEYSYFSRHWSGGSHLRLHMCVEPGPFMREVEPFARREIEAYLSVAPSNASFTEEDAQRLFERRRHMASYTGPVYETLRPNNTVEVAPYDALASTVGSEGAAQLLEDYYVETNDLAFAIIEQTRNNYTARLNACFDQLLAIAATSPLLPLRRAYMSYRSHVEAYIICEPMVEEPKIRRKRLEIAYEARRPAIRKRVLRTLSLIENAPERLPDWLRQMIEVHRRYSDSAFQGAQAGFIRLKTDEEVEEESDKALPIQESAFHSAVRQNKAVLEAINRPDMVGHRVDLNFLYLQLNRIGMLNEDRYILDYYIANAVEELLGIDPVAAIQASGA